MVGLALQAGLQRVELLGGADRHAEVPAAGQDVGLRRARTAGPDPPAAPGRPAAARPARARRRSSGRPRCAAARRPRRCGCRPSRPARCGARRRRPGPPPAWRTSRSSRSGRAPRRQHVRGRPRPGAARTGRARRRPRHAGVTTLDGPAVGDGRPATDVCCACFLSSAFCFSQRAEPGVRPHAQVELRGRRARERRRDDGRGQVARRAVAEVGHGAPRFRSVVRWVRWGGSR